jgi:hypothetical protein
MSEQRREPKFKQNDVIVSNNGKIRTVIDVNEKEGFYILKSEVDNIVSEDNENINAIDLTNEKYKQRMGGKSVVTASAKQDALPRSQKNLAKIVINENKNYKMRSIFNIYLT